MTRCVLSRPPCSFCLAGAVFLAAVLSLGPAAHGDEAGGAQLLEYRKIWDAAPHSGFTDLIRFKGQWFVTFREGRDPQAPGSDIRVMTSPDGREWASTSLLAMLGQDVRDPKLEITPDNRLMLNTVIRFRPASGGKNYQSYVYFSDDGWRWEGPHEIGEPEVGIWRVTWHKGVCYGVGYRKLFPGDFKRKRAIIRLYRSADGRKWDVLADDFLKGPVFPNEAALAFAEDDTCYCLMRCTDYDRPNASVPAMLGVSKPPYTAWKWKNLGVGVGGPELKVLSDGRLLAASRYYGKEIETRLCWVDPVKGALEPCLTLPSGYFNGYPALVEYDGLIWVSNHASFEGNPKEHSCIYIGKVKLEKGPLRQASLVR